MCPAAQRVIVLSADTYYSLVISTKAAVASFVSKNYARSPLFCALEALVSANFLVLPSKRESESAGAMNHLSKRRAGRPMRENLICSGLMS
jgi:hypothetical protein